MTEAGSRRLRRQWLVTMALTVTALAARHAAAHGPWLGVAYILFFIFWLWIPIRFRTWRNDLILAGIAVAGLTLAALNPEWRSLAEVLIFPIPGFLAHTAPTAPPTPWAWLSVLGLAVARVAMTPHVTVNITGPVVTLGGIFFGVYGSRIRREARELDRQRMVELEAAYGELQATHQQLVETTQAAAEARAREERLQIAADIHDGVGHRLTSLIIGLESMEMMLPRDMKAAQERFPDLLTTARQALSEVRQAVHASQEADEQFNQDAFLQLVDDAGRDGQWETAVCWQGDPVRWPAPIRITLFRVPQESLTNILRHAQANRVEIEVLEHANAVTLHVEDDGVLAGGLAPGFGLNQMQNRCLALGGTLTWEPRSPHGLVVTANIPLEVEGA